MTPEGDSIVHVPTTVSFQNASINATDYRFIYEGFVFPMNTPLLNTGIDAGLTTIKLVAYNGNCTDTTVAYYFYAGNFPTDTDNVRRAYGYSNREHEMTGVATLMSGSNLIYGHRKYSDYYHESQTGLLIRTKQSGCVEWARKIPSEWNFSSSVASVKESADSNLYMIAQYEWMPVYLSKVDPSGNMLWVRSLKDASGNFDRLLGIEPAPDSGVIAVSAPSSAITFNVTRFNKDGLMLWQKHFDLNVMWSSWFKNILIKDGYVYIGGNANYDNVASYGAILTKLNLANGQTVWTKKYTNDSEMVTLNEMVSVDSTIVMNILSNTGNPLQPPIGGIMRIDTSGAVMYASLIGDTFVPNPIVGPFGASSSHLTKSGKNYYIITAGAHPLGLQGDGHGTFQIRLDSSFQVKWVSYNGGVAKPYYFFNSPAPKDGSFIGGLEFGPAISSYSFSLLLTTVTIDSSGGNPNANCYFYQQTWAMYTPSITVTPLQWTIDASATNSAEVRNFPWLVYYPEMRFKCPDYVDSCSYLKVSGPASICNLTQTYTYFSHKNKSCGQPTSWFVSAGMQTISQTDTSVTVRFLNFGRHVIYGRNILTCVPVEDSIVIIAASTTPPLNLGADFSICPGNTRILHAGNLFMHYEWQDGSTDSLLTINQPGRYWVKVTDSCNNIISDTIDVILAPPVPMSIGPDRQICARDTVHLTATPGFMNYQWSPAYQASATTGQAIVVSPLVDTMYTVIGEMTPGCLAYDTMRITVHGSPPINLGRDTSFCLGDSVRLDAGIGFTTYAWNTGGSAQQIVVKNTGLYSVIGTTVYGCKSYDTLSVLNVFNLPQPLLDHSTVLCEGVPRQLNPGSGYVQYNWSNGASTQMITINGTGQYSVVVTDANGCKGTDTTRITTIQPTPALFLPADVSICSYETASLNPVRTYNNYLWSTGSLSQSISVSNPGSYWLQVGDQYGCTGKDSITVLLKTDCITGVFVPTAFTPNNDGKNDLFKPLIYGNTLQYSFRVYNRWGDIVFQSANPSLGWDGKLKGVTQDSNVFVWTLLYQLEGQAVKQQHGTVMLMR